MIRIASVRIPREIFGWLCAGLVLIASLIVHSCESQPIPALTVTDSTTITENETPAAPLPVLARVGTSTVQPVARRIAPGAARGDVSSFCSAAGWGPPGAHLAPVEDSTAVSPAVDASPASAQPPSASFAAQLNPIALVRSGEVDRRALNFRMVSSSTDLLSDTFSVRFPAGPPYSFRADGDSVIVRASRFGGVRDLVPVSLCGGGAYLGHELGTPLPTLIGCALGILDVVL